MKRATPIGIAALVVTYRPQDDVLPRLVQYAQWFAHVVVVDNTESRSVLHRLVTVEGLTYVPLLRNAGIGEALNIGLRAAKQRGYRQVLLLDQDSAVLEASAERVLQFVDGAIGIVAMRPVDGSSISNSASIEDAPAIVDVPVAITSGSLLNMSAFEACGPFDEKLFIDYVDFDYCLRLRRGGWRLVQCPTAPMPHALGEPRQIHRFGRSFRYVSHAPFRSYYRVRNALRIISMHGAAFPQIAADIVKVMAKELVKALLVEDRRGERLRYMVTGIFDWARGRYGALKGT